MTAPSRPQRAARGSTRQRAAAGFTAGAGLLLLLTACSAAPRGGSEAARVEYLETLRRSRAAGPALAPGSPEERQAIERFRGLLGDYKAPDFAARIREVYAEDVFFNDTLKTLHGVDEVEAYLIETAATIDLGRVEFLDLVSRDGDYYFRWLLTVRARRLAGGEEIRSVGMSHVRFDAAGRVVLHQDFWDSAGGLYEHVPAVGWLLRRVKKRL